MKIVHTDIDGLLVIEPRVFEDERGFFYESFNQKTWKKKTNLNTKFVQDNFSQSEKGVLRGLHFQNPPFTQEKLVTVLSGAVLDVAVDLRKKSKTYGAHFKIELTAESKKQLFVPKGFAHGFLVLEDNTQFFYKCSEFYHPESEASILWNDPKIGINWKIKNPVLSEKDKRAINFINFESPF